MLLDTQDDTRGSRRSSRRRGGGKATAPGYVPDVIYGNPDARHDGKGWPHQGNRGPRGLGGGRIVILTTFELDE